MQNERLEVALHLISECGEMLKSTRHCKLEYKDGLHDLVSDMDREIERYLIDQLSMRFPTDYFLCEESLKESGRHTWIIDPIDGTTNFVNAHEDFAISIAYYKHMEPVFGIVYDVMKGELYLGIAKEGAWVNQRPLAPLKDKTLGESVVDISMRSILSLQEHQKTQPLQLQGKIRGHRSLGCASLCICHIAKGTLDAYISTNVKCWDYGAAWIILREVQGVSWIQGDYFTSDGTTAIFSNSQSSLDALIDICIA